MLSLDHRLSGYQGSVSSRDPESLCRRPLLVPPSCASEINNLCLERSRKERLGAVSTCSLCCSCWVPSYGMKAATDNTQTKGLFNSSLHLLPRKIDLWYWKKRGNLNSLNSMHVINLLLSLFLISHTKLNLQDVEKTSHQANPCESDSYPQYIGSSPPFPRRKTIPACLCQLPSDQCLELNSWKTLGSSWKLF